MKQGLLLIYTGHGKGKSSAAFGQALRAAGHGLRVCIIQFVKARESGELKAITALPEVELHQVGSGFSWQDREKFRHSAQKGWQLAREKITGDYQLVILDELTYLLNYDILDPAEVCQTLQNRPPGQHLLITGRDAPAELLAIADLVTEMRQIKHPFQQGVQAQRGIEF